MGLWSDLPGWAQTLIIIGIVVVVLYLFIKFGLRLFLACCTGCLACCVGIWAACALTGRSTSSTKKVNVDDPGPQLDPPVIILRPENESILTIDIEKVDSDSDDDTNGDKNNPDIIDMQKGAGENDEDAEAMTKLL